MGIAADAISDLIAPPRSDPAPPADASRDDGPSFADHLSATDQTRPAPDNRAAPSSARDKSDASREPARSATEQKSDRAPTDRASQRASSAKNTDPKTEPTDAQSAQAAQAAVAATVQIKVATTAPQNPAPSSLMQVLAHLVAQNQSTTAETEVVQEPPAQDVPADAKSTAEQQVLATQLPPPQATGKPQTKHAPAGKTAASNTKHAPASASAGSPADHNVNAAAPTPPQVLNTQAAPAPAQADAAAPKTDAQPASDAAQMLAAMTLPGPQAATTPPAKQSNSSIDADGIAVVKTPPMPALKVAAAPAPSAKAVQAKMAGAVAAQQAAKQAFAVPNAPTPAASERSDASSFSSALASQAPAQSSAVATADAAARAAPVAAQVGREIIRRSTTGSTRFEMRLDPPELGRVDVRLEVSRDHRVTAVISADNPQALNELSRGARDLQQALQSAGLELSDDGLSFDLSNQQNAFAQADNSNSQQRGPNNTQTTAPLAEAAPLARPLSIDSWRGGRVDVVA